MKTFSERRERIEVEEEVFIPALDGATVAETIKVKVPAWRDPKDGEIYFDGEALRILDRAKARHMGLLTPEQIKALRERLGLTQKQISELLQIGEKTWTRWETGRERPSRSINVLLLALNDGKLDLAYLKTLARLRKDGAMGKANREFCPQFEKASQARDVATQLAESPVPYRIKRSSVGRNKK